MAMELKQLIKALVQTTLENALIISASEIKSLVSLIPFCIADTGVIS